MKRKFAFECANTPVKVTMDAFNPSAIVIKNNVLMSESNCVFYALYNFFWAEKLNTVKYSYNESNNKNF